MFYSPVIYRSMVPTVYRGVCPPALPSAPSLPQGSSSSMASKPLHPVYGVYLMFRDRDLLEVHCNQWGLGLCARDLLHSSLTFCTLWVVNGGGVKQCKGTVLEVHCNLCCFFRSRGGRFTDNPAWCVRHQWWRIQLGKGMLPESGVVINGVFPESGVVIKGMGLWNERHII